MRRGKYFWGRFLLWRDDVPFNSPLKKVAARRKPSGLSASFRAKPGGLRRSATVDRLFQQAVRAPGLEANMTSAHADRWPKILVERFEESTTGGRKTSRWRVASRPALPIGLASHGGPGRSVLSRARYLPGWRNRGHRRPFLFIPVLSVGEPADAAREESFRPLFEAVRSTE